MWGTTLAVYVRGTTHTSSTLGMHQPDLARKASTSRYLQEEGGRVAVFPAFFCCSGGGRGGRSPAL